jgi:hypothetical protein
MGARCTRCGFPIAGNVADPIIHRSAGVFHAACSTAHAAAVARAERERADRRRARRAELARERFHKSAAASPPKQGELFK